MTVAPSLQVEASDGRLTFTIDRPDRRNSLSEGLLEELHQALTRAEEDPRCKVVVLRGKDGNFCTGMDFEEVVAKAGDPASGGEPYARLLRRFTETSRVVISAVDGKVMAGGIGLVAASDLVIATPTSRFSLPEALWGLLPAVVAPYLIRRVGFQPAYLMMLTTRELTAAEAQPMHLVDEVADDLDRALEPHVRRLTRLDPRTVTDLKAYMRKLSLLTDAMDEAAVHELHRLLGSSRIQENISNYARYGRLPWEAW